MDVSFENKKLRLNIFGATQRPLMDSYFEINKLKDIIEEATPIILTQDSLDICLAHFRVDNFDLEGYIQEVNTLLDTSQTKTLPP